MKTKLGIYLAVLFCLPLSCADETIAPSMLNGTLGEAVMMKKADIVVYAANDTESLKIKVTEIYDSRCPSDVVCVWQGMVGVVFDISGLDYIVQLCIGDISGCSSMVEFTIGQNTYSIELLTVNPYPSTQNSNEEKVVEFVVKKL